MNNNRWTFGKKIAGGFFLTIGLSLIVGAIAVFALQQVTSTKDKVIDHNARLLVDAERLRGFFDGKVSDTRAFLISGDEPFVTAVANHRAGFFETLDRLEQNAETEEGRRLLAVIREGEADHQIAIEDAIALGRSGASSEEMARAQREQLAPRRITVDSNLDAFVALEERILTDAQDDSSNAAFIAGALVVGVTAVVVLLGAVVAFFLSRNLSRQIGNSVSQVESSSAELQGAATQQAAASRDQALAMSEIATTITELLATSRQIVESAQHVSAIASQTSTAASDGEQIVDSASAAMDSIRVQMDQIVGNMLDLGEKSQEIGAVLDIVSELAEQTNILAINATIEAAGAGEAGKRFAVVADEIRKLADRVGGSTQEVRRLIEDVRRSINTTVMATETGAKAVDSGTSQFKNVTSALTQIRSLVVSTTEASREIELSTKQQSTAVEQVNVAIASTAQATQETEASSKQTLQTASELAKLSNSLLKLVKAEAAG